MSSPWINYHHLYYFKTIAEEGSVSKAAEKLRLGQPTLSAQLKQFEDALGVKLFDREHKKLILTEQGKVALDYSKNIFKMGSEMYEAIHDRLKPNKTSLCIGALDSVPKQIILQLVKQATKFADCHISLSEGKSEELIREVSAHRLDLIVTNFLPVEVNARGLFHRTVTQNPVAIFASSTYKNIRKNFPASISQQPLILPTYDSKLRYDIDHWARSNDIELNIAVESQDIAVKKLLAVEGTGLMITSTHSVQRQILSGELIEIGKLEGVKEELFLMTADRKIKNSIAAHLMKAFKI